MLWLILKSSEAQMKAVQIKATTQIHDMHSLFFVNRFWAEPV